MKDELFISRILQRGREAKDKVVAEFSSITEDQLNWQPAPQSWSIGQCLEHLIVADSSYFSDLREITEGKYKMAFWEKYSPFTGFFGQIFKTQLKEQVRIKMVAPKKIRPKGIVKNLEIINTYHKNLDTFLAYISNCRHVDLDRTIITSPFISIVTYSLRDVFLFLAEHEHRHINQAIRVKANEHFPTANNA